VATAIGVVIVAAVLVSYLGSGKARRYQSAISQMNQDAQIGLELLSREIQLSGYSQPRALININAANAAITPSFVVSYNLGTLTAPIFGCDGTKGSVPFSTPTGTTVTCSGASTTPTVSAFEVAYEADLKNTIRHSTGVPTDCLGQSLVQISPGNGLPYYAVRNRYFISTATGTATSGRPELYCASDKTGGNSQPILENVEDLQVWYGVSANANSRQIIRYAKAGKDNTTASTINAVGASEWQNIVSMKICLLMRSSETVFNEVSTGVGNEDTLTYTDCNGDTKASADRLLRRAYFTTSTLRSKMPF
jgi:type IV pilus assembly protein PilW